MRSLRPCLAFCVLVFALGLVARAALGDPSMLGTGARRDVVLARAGAAAPFFVAADDWPGVQRAAGDLQADIERVTGLKPFVSTGNPIAAPVVVVVGTVGRSPLIDGLDMAGKLNVEAIRGKWEALLNC